MKKETKAKNFIPKPEFKGGPKALTAFIYQQLKYPPEAYENKTEGTVVLKAEINYKGEVIGTKIISSIGSGCDEEAARVVSLLKFHIEKVRNLKVIFFKTFNIQFKLTITQTNTVSYVYVTEDKPDTKPDTKEKPSTNYTYVIKYN